MFLVDISLGGYWTLVNVEISTPEGQQLTLPVIGKQPSAPLMPAYSYKCSHPLVFGNENVTLTMQNIQVRDLWVQCLLNMARGKGALMCNYAD